MKLLRLIRAIFSPMKLIAAELRIIRELYELELESRNPPIMRVTETPNPRFDTEVWSGEEETKPGWRKFLAFDKPEEEPDGE